MGVLQRFERRLGGLVEGAFAKVFKGGVEPVEIASALARETDDRRATSANRILVPNEFAVELASGDFARLAPYTRALCDELAEMVREHAAEQRYTFVGPVGVRLAEAEDLDVGVFRIRSSVAAADPGAVAGRRVTGRHRSAVPGAPRLMISTKPGPDGRDSGEKREYPLESETTVIGRSVECDIRLNDTGVSRRHGEVRRMPDGQFVYIDHGSTNGSIVNGRPASQVKLVDGDQIELGSTILAFHREDPRGADAGRAAGRAPAGMPSPAAPYPAAPMPAAVPADPHGRPAAGPYREEPRHGGQPAGYPPPPADPYREDPYRGGDPRRDDPRRGEPRRPDPRHGGQPAGYPPPPADPYREDPYRAGGRPAAGQHASGPPVDPYGGGPRYDAPYGGREDQHRGGADPHDSSEMRAAHPPRNGYGDPQHNVPPAGPDDDDIHEQQTYRPGQFPSAGRRQPQPREGEPRGRQPREAPRSAGPGASAPTDHDW